MNQKFIKDCARVIALVVAGGFLFGTLAHIFRVEQPSYVTNVSQPCVIAPVTIPAER